MPQPEGHLPQVVKKKEGHMPELRKRRSHLALLGVFAMVASVLAAGASPVTAEAGKAEGAASYSACVGPAAVDAGFTDVATGSTHDAAVNCIAYYGITKGTTATTFAPNRTISRWQLAVMLQRASGPAGVDLPDDEDMGFTDISGLNSGWQTAINQMAKLGVMAGTTATTFDPSGVVSRAVIVEALAGFLTNATVGPGGKALSRGVDRTLTLKRDASAGATSVPIDETFRDLGGVSYSAFQSIRALAEMGVVSGRADGTFGPAASVTRAQAAAFITRALAHTNARPAGLTMQAAKDDGSPAATVTSTDNFNLSISVRGNDFAPVGSASVDVFQYLARNAGSAFKADGTCNTAGVGGVSTAGSEAGLTVCAIEIGDPVTESDGNLPVALSSISQSSVFWAWTGDTGDKLDWDTSANLSMDNATVSSAASISVDVVTSPQSAKVTSSVSADAAGGNTVRYGTTVTITIQLLDENDKEIGIADRPYTWWAEGAHDDESVGRLRSTGSRTITTDSDGKATFTLTQLDPDTDRRDDDNRTTWTYNIQAGTGSVAPTANTAIGFTVDADSVGTGMVVFDDSPPKAQKVSIALQRAWTPQPSQGASVRVGVTGKVTDQYGNAQREVPIFFDIDGNSQFGCDDPDANDCGQFGQAANTEDETIANGRIGGTERRNTSSRGTNTIEATLSAEISGTVSSEDAEGLGESAPTYRVAADLNADGDVSDSGEIATAIHYWAQPAFGLDAATGDADSTPLWDIKVADLANNALIQASRRPDPETTRVPRVYNYTDTTIFKWWVNGAPDEERWIDAADFERRMAKVIAIDPTQSPGARMAITQYKTKTGFSIIEIRLNTGTDIFDPPAG